MEEASAFSESEDFEEEEEDEDEDGEVSIFGETCFPDFFKRWFVGLFEVRAKVEDGERGRGDWARASGLGDPDRELDVFCLTGESRGMPYSEPNRTRTLLLDNVWGADALRLLKAEGGVGQVAIAVVGWIACHRRIGTTRWGIWLPDGISNCGCRLATKAAGPKVDARPQDSRLAPIPFRR